MKNAFMRTLACVALVACGGGGSPTGNPAEVIQPPDGATVQMVKDGRDLYRGGSCKACHGLNGKEGPYGPNLTDATWLHIDGSYASIIAIVTSGVAASQFKSPTSQPQFEMYARGGSALTDDQVKAVAAYAWTLSHSAQ